MTVAVLKAGDAKNGRLAYDFKPFDFKQAVMEAVAYIRHDAEAKKLTLRISIPEGIDWTVKGDKAQIVEHVLKNLITNAVLYTPAGSVTVTLEKSDQGIRLSVTDSGVGITEEDKARLFMEGGKGKDSTKSNVHSTGYGLYLAKTVVDAHHGRIWAESDGPNRGSTFVIELPILSS
jgi:signal transduction histidine kinase